VVESEGSYTSTCICFQGVDSDNFILVLRTQVCVPRYTWCSRDATLPFFRLFTISYVNCVSNQRPELAVNLDNFKVCHPRCVCN